MKLTLPTTAGGSVTLSVWTIVSIARVCSNYSLASDAAAVFSGV